MALAGRLGATLDALLPRDPATLFGEDQARYVVTTWNSDPVVRAMAAEGIPHTFLGSVGGDALALPDGRRLPLAALREAHEGFFPKLMG